MREVPGLKVVATSAVGSRNGGRKFFPMSVKVNQATTMSSAVPTTTNAGCESASRIHVALKPALSQRTRMKSLCSLPGLGFSRKELSTGITVSETMKEAAMLTMVATAIGVKSLPSTPESAINGRNTRMISTVA